MTVGVVSRTDRGSPPRTLSASYSDDSSDSDSDDDGTIGSSASARRQQLPFLSVFDVKSIETLFSKNNIKLDHAFKIWRHLVKKGYKDWNDVPGIPKIALKLLNDNFKLTTSRIIESQNSSDGSTTKLLIEVQDGKRIESVIMRYGQVGFSTFPEHLLPSSTPPNTAGRFRSLSRSTLCVSSQVGCGMACCFCATGTMGLMASLTSGEILEQLYHAIQMEPIRNVVFMGMGEPLDNFEEVKDAIKLMTDVRVFNLSPHRVSLSTVGVVPRLKQLQDELPNVSLALSLHAPTQEIREKIVPSAKNWKLNDILDAAFNFVRMQKRISQRNRKYQGLLLEYVLIKDINSSVAVAEQLGHLLADNVDLVILNVIPYNPISSAESLKRPTDDEIDAFTATVRKFGVLTFLRQTLGLDISGACGQLVVKNQKQTCSNKDLEDLLQDTPTRLSTEAAQTTPSKLETPSSTSSTSSTSCDYLPHHNKRHYQIIVNRLMNTTLVERLIMSTTVLSLVGFLVVCKSHYRRESFLGLFRRLISNKKLH